MVEDVAIRDVERELARMREEMSEPGGPPALRTSSATHIAWVPERWEQAAIETRIGLAERHPSRVIMLYPRPDAVRDALDAHVELTCFRNDALGREVCAEVISIRLNGRRAEAPASVVLPLLVSDLPVFLRWRGDLPRLDGGASRVAPFEQLVGIADRLIVDSGEWADPDADLPRLAALGETIAVSDLAWARVEPWRIAVAALWPGIAGARHVRVAGPRTEALLLAHWLSERLGRMVELEHEPASRLEAVEVDGARARARPDTRSASDLLSEQLDEYGRDPIYEAAVALGA